MVRTRLDLLAKLEQDVLDRSVPLGDLLSSCQVIAAKARATQLHGWATTELDGYHPLDAVPDYRRVAAPIMCSIMMPYRGIVTQPFNIRSVPDGVRESLGENVPLNQPIDELESLASRYEAQNKPVSLEVFCSDLLMSILNKNNPFGPQLVAMTWWIDPAVIRGVLGRIRTMLTEFVIELHAEVSASEELPAVAQIDEVLGATIPSAIFNNSPVTIVTASTKSGDIMPTGPRTTIKDNKTKISDSTGNVSVASAHVAQVSGGEIDLAKVREFAELLAQIGPTLGLAADQAAELQGAAGDLARAASAPNPERGRLRRALDQVIRMLRVAAPSAARRLAISMGEEVIRELGDEVIRNMPH